MLAPGSKRQDLPLGRERRAIASRVLDWIGNNRASLSASIFNTDQISVGLDDTPAKERVDVVRKASPAAHSSTMASQPPRSYGTSCAPVRRRTITSSTPVIAVEPDDLSYEAIGRALEFSRNLATATGGKVSRAAGAVPVCDPDDSEDCGESKARIRHDVQLAGLPVTVWACDLDTDGDLDHCGRTEGQPTP